MSETPKQHLKRCIERAMEHMDAGRALIAVDGFMNDIVHHEGTACIASHGATPVVLLASAHNPEKFRAAMEGLSVQL